MENFKKLIVTIFLDFCLQGIVTHFFFLSTFCWLFLISVDLWLTFRYAIFESIDIIPWFLFYFISTEILIYIGHLLQDRDRGQKD